MNPTYLMYSQAVAWTSGKNMMSINNDTGSGKQVHIHRIHIQNNSTTTVRWRYLFSIWGTLF